MLDLTQINLATEEDRFYQLDRWAAFFKAATWEELKMLAKNNPDLQEAAATVCHLSQDEKIRQMCEAREDYYRRTAGRENLLQKTRMQLAQAVEENKRLLQATKENKQIIEENKQITEKNRQITEENKQITEKNRQITEENRQITEENKQITEENKQITEENRRLLQIIKSHGIDINKSLSQVELQVKQDEQH